MYLQQFHLNIKYKKGSTNHVADCLSRPQVVALTIVLNSVGMRCLRWPQLYNSDSDFTSTYQTLNVGKPVPYFHLQDGFAIPSEPYLCSFKRACKAYLGSSLQSSGKTLWCGKNSGSTTKSFLLVEASTRCMQVHQILHYLCHFQTHHQETRAIHPSSYSEIGLGSPSPWITCMFYLQPSMGMTMSSWLLIDSLR
jgi:hypothetical protein